MSGSDAETMEQSLLTLGDAYDGMAAELYDRFLAAHPQHAAAFITPDASRERMTRETLEAMLGLATGETWVGTAISNTVDLHRNYADFAVRDYREWLALVIEVLGRRAGDRWTGAVQSAWERQAEALAALVEEELSRQWSHKKTMA